MAFRDKWNKWKTHPFCRVSKHFQTLIPRPLYHVSNVICFKVDLVSPPYIYVLKIHRYFVLKTVHHVNKRSYLTLCTFSFEIKEGRPSDTRCLIQDAVSPHCGDKRMAQRCTRRSLPNYFDVTSYHWNVRQNTVTWHWWMNGKK